MVVEVAVAGTAMAPVGHPTTQAHMGVTAEVLGAALHTKANKVGLESKWPGGRWGRSFRGTELDRSRATVRGAIWQLLLVSLGGWTWALATPTAQSSQRPQVAQLLNVGTNLKSHLCVRTELWDPYLWSVSQHLT